MNSNERLHYKGELALCHNQKCSQVFTRASYRNIHCSKGCNDNCTYCRTKRAVRVGYWPSRGAIVGERARRTAAQ